MFCRLMGHFGGLCWSFMKEKKKVFLLYVVFNKHEKSTQVVIFIFFFSFCFVLGTFMHGFALLPFLLSFFRFSSWFVAAWLPYIFGVG